MNPTSAENQLPGSPHWQLRNIRFDAPVTMASFPLVRHLRSSAIEGYASKTSLYPGETIDFMISLDPPGELAIDIYRMGYYGGIGARHMTRIAPLSAAPQPMPAMSMQRLRECAWQPAAALTIPDDWHSGVYLAKLTRDEGPYGVGSYIIFVVKSRRKADILCQVSDLTWQAYNKWPANDSLYTDGTANVWYQGTEVRVGFDRPYAKYCQVLDAPLSTGSGEFLLWEHPMAYWLEREGYHVAYCSNLDLHLDPSVLDRCKAFLSVGHDEYWSREMFNAALNARDDGLSLAFFSGNSVYWEIEFHDSPLNPAAACRAFSRKRLFAGEEAQLMGVSSYGPGYGDWTITNPSHWSLENTGLAHGDSIPAAIGWEYHGRPADIPGLEIIASSELFQGDKTPREPAHAAIAYPCARGNWVFNAGTIWWPEGLSHPPGHIPARLSVNSTTVQSAPGSFGVSPHAQRITANILNRMLRDSPRK